MLNGEVINKTNPEKSYKFWNINVPPPNDYEENIRALFKDDEIEIIFEDKTK